MKLLIIALTALLATLAFVANLEYKERQRHDVYYKWKACRALDKGYDTISDSCKPYSYWTNR